MREKDLRVLVVGCGDVGGKVAGSLAQMGHAVVGVRRGAGGIPDGVSALRADVASAEGAALLPADVDLVVMTVAAGRSDEEGYRRTYLESAQRVSERVGLGRAGGPRFVFVSSTSVWEFDDGRWVDEEMPAQAEHFSGRVMLEAEAALVARGGDLRVLRLGGIYGPGRQRMLRLVREGKAAFEEEPAVWTNRIHRDDAVGMILHLGLMEGLGGVWVGCDAEPAPRAEVFQWLARQMGVEGRGVNKLPARGSKRCSSAKIRGAGYELRYPSFREGYAQLIAGDQA